MSRSGFGVQCKSGLELACRNDTGPCRSPPGETPALPDRFLAVDLRRDPRILANAVGLVRRRCAVAGGRLDQAFAARFAGEGHLLVGLVAPDHAEDTLGAELRERAGTRGFFLVLAAEDGRIVALARRALGIFARQQRTVVYAFGVGLALLLGVLGLLRALDVRIVRPAGGLGGGVGLFGRRQLLAVRQHQRRALAIIDALF